MLQHIRDIQTDYAKSSTVAEKAHCKCSLTQNNRDELLCLLTDAILICTSYNNVKFIIKLQPVQRFYLVPVYIYGSVVIRGLI